MQVLCTMGRLEAKEIEQVEPQPPNFPKVEMYGCTLVEQLLPSVPIFLLHAFGILIALILYLTGYLAVLTDFIVDRWRQ